MKIDIATLATTVRTVRGSLPTRASREQQLPQTWDRQSPLTTRSRRPARPEYGDEHAVAMRAIVARMRMTA